MQQEYSYTGGWKIFGYVICGGIIGGMGYGLVNSIITNEQVGLFLGLFVACLALFSYCLLGIVRTKVTITEDSISYRDVFKTKLLFFSDIKGYRIISGQYGANTLVIMPKMKGKSSIRIGSASYFGKGDQLFGFVQGRFKDIDNKEYEDEVDEILHDPNVGITEDDRSQRLQRVTKTARLLNGIGIVLMFWLFFYPQPYPVPIYIALVYPFIALGFFVRNQGLVTLAGVAKKKSAYPSVSSGFIYVPVALLIRVLLDYDLLDFTKVLVPCAIVAVVLIGGLLMLIRQSKNRSLDIGGAVVFGLLFGYGSVVSANCLFDNGKPEVHYAKVLDKRYTTGKGSSYYLTLSAWGTKASGEEETVASSFYYEVSKGDSVAVCIKKGTLNVPWYYITK